MIEPLCYQNCHPLCSGGMVGTHGHIPFHTCMQAGLDFCRVAHKLAGYVERGPAMYPILAHRTCTPKKLGDIAYRVGKDCVQSYTPTVSYSPYHFRQ